MSRSEIPHEREAQTAYVLLGITFVPHYYIKNAFVGPGNKILYVDYLKLFNAQRVTLALWPRRYS